MQSGATTPVQNKYELAWGERKLARRLKWGAVPAVVPLYLLSKPLGWYFETAFFTNCAYGVCALAGMYGSLLVASFRCPKCGKRFGERLWWFPDRCGSCGIRAGTIPPNTGQEQD